MSKALDYRGNTGVSAKPTLFDPNMKGQHERIYHICLRTVVPYAQLRKQQAAKYSWPHTYLMVSLIGCAENSAASSGCCTQD